ncbi:integrase [Rhizobium sp. J15]|uniref:tyrosine-type recombinase/integrase n=1 Tax=Rhizobium sp. J15 TaxID=2035450 RepID=UPI000BE91670|nr:site-specific integrase [Rhizobium sp. J15]PDT15853.1 integrase [Rhizobium sp. J15]
MVVTVKLEGLNIVKARGKWYVYPRSGGEAYVKGFEGTREELIKHLEKSAEFTHAYNRPRLAKRAAKNFPIECLGGFVYWYTNGDIDKDLKACLQSPGALEKGYPKWQKLAASTRKDYLEAFEYLRPEFDSDLKDITQPDLYEVRDRCANVKWPRFADQMISALSSLFRQAVRRGKMPFNPCLGMDKTHKADPNANREWEADELQYVRDNAPMEVLIPVMLARYAGLRGQTLVDVNRKQFRSHHLTGQAVRYKARKNNKLVTLPVLQELQDFLVSLKLQRADGLICVRDDGSAWPSEKEMQTRVSHWLRDQERENHIGSGTTLHGLRVTYAAWWKRTTGANNREIADLLGDESEAMGAHYTRHVETEANIARAFSRVKKNDP